MSSLPNHLWFAGRTEPHSPSPERSKGLCVICFQAAFSWRGGEARVGNRSSHSRHRSTKVWFRVPRSIRFWRQRSIVRYSSCSSPVSLRCGRASASLSARGWRSRRDCMPSSWSKLLWTSGYRIVRLPIGKYDQSFQWSEISIVKRKNHESGRARKKC